MKEESMNQHFVNSCDDLIDELILSKYFELVMNIGHCHCHWDYLYYNELRLSIHIQLINRFLMYGNFTESINLGFVKRVTYNLSSQSSYYKFSWDSKNGTKSKYPIIYFELCQHISIEIDCHCYLKFHKIKN